MVVVELWVAARLCVVGVVVVEGEFAALVVLDVIDVMVDQAATGVEVIVIVLLGVAVLGSSSRLCCPKRSS